MKNVLLIVLGCLIALDLGCSSKHPGAKTTDEMTDFAQRYAKAWSGQEPKEVAKFFSESGSLKVNDGPTAAGRDEIARVARSFMSAFPDMVVTMDKIVIKGDITEFHWTLTGTNNGVGGKAIGSK